MTTRSLCLIAEGLLFALTSQMSAAAPGSAVLSAVVNYPVGTNPLALVTGDFNNDGDLDVATANSGGISVLLGDGAGGFGAAIGTAAGYHADYYLASLAVADFNKDGNLDVAMAFYGQTYENGQFGSEWSGVGVGLGNGQGAFEWVSQQFITGYGVPLSVVAGDFNNDGNSDLVVFSEYDSFGYYQDWHGDSHGGFTTEGASQLSNPHHAQAVGDLNGDGNLDMVGDDIILLGPAPWSAAPIYYGNGDWHYVGQVGVAIGDFTGEGIPDLVTAISSVDMHIGHGDGTVNWPPITNVANGNQHTGVALADFNGDGLLDAVTSDWDQGTISALLGNGNGTVTYAGAYAAGTSPSGVAVGDFNGDGRPDVATANSGSNNVSVLLNQMTCTTFVAPDLDHDCDVDSADVTAFKACASRAGVPVAPACQSRDFDGDNDADMNDFAILQRCYGNAVPSCLN